MPEPPEVRLRELGISPALSAAHDVLDDAGCLTGERLKLCAAAERQGRDPVERARRLVGLCRLFKGAK